MAAIAQSHTQHQPPLTQNPRAEHTSIKNSSLQSVEIMGKRILITGVSKGLGYAMTEGFIAQGHTVIGCARSVAAIEKMKSSFSAPNDFAAVDVANEQQVKNWATEILAKWALKAVPFILKLKPKDNGIPLTVPG